MRLVDLLVSAETAGSSGSYYRTNWPSSSHRLSKSGLILASD